jgi:hypothetical protein
MFTQGSWFWATEVQEDGKWQTQLRDKSEEREIK